MTGVIEKRKNGCECETFLKRQERPGTRRACGRGDDRRDVAGLRARGSAAPARPHARRAARPRLLSLRRGKLEPEHELCSHNSSAGSPLSQRLRVALRARSAKALAGFWVLICTARTHRTVDTVFGKLKSAACVATAQVGPCSTKAKHLRSCRRCSAIGAPLRSSRHRRRRAPPSQTAFSPSDSVPHCCRRLCRSHNSLPKARTAI